MSKTTVLWPLVAVLALAACDKQEAPGADAGATPGKGFLGIGAADDAGGEPEGAAKAAVSGLPQPDMGKPLDGYPELQSGQQIMFLYVAASKLPPDFAKMAESYSQEYRDTSDSFRKNDLLQAIKPQLEQQIAATAASPYAWMLVDNGRLDAYDFGRKGFAVNEFKRDNKRYFYDNSNYQLSWANRDQVLFASVPDESKARELESLRTQYALQLKIYFFAQSADLNSRIVNAYVTRVQALDRSGRVVLEYGPEGG